MTEIARASIERRSGMDRRKLFSLSHFFYRGQERRTVEERRSQSERRSEWVRISKWSSAFLLDLKIAKFLKKVSILP